jgi:hypothetical protein
VQSPFHFSEPYRVAPSAWNAFELGRRHDVARKRAVAESGREPLDPIFNPNAPPRPVLTRTRFSAEVFRKVCACGVYS